VTGSNLKLVPDGALPKNTPNASSTGRSPDAFVPRFGRPKILMPDDFWSNLKQFLFERPVKIRGDYRSPLMPTEYGGGFWANVGEFFRSRPVPKGSTKGQLARRWDTSLADLGIGLETFSSRRR